MPVSKFFRVAVEGDTTDGRQIERAWIQQMADGFDRTKYGARVWLEHIRGILPDSPFKSYGDVVELKAEEVTIDGKKKLGLFASIDATPDLVAMNKARQKMYTSIEVSPDFAKTGLAYLTGLAVTDSPASLGTEMLAFAAGATINPLEERKQDKANLFTAAAEVKIEFEDEVAQNTGETLFSKVKELLGLKGKTDDAKFCDIGHAIEAIATSQKSLLDQFSSNADAFKQSQQALKTLQDSVTADRAEFTSLKASLEAEPNNTNRRPHASGSNGATATDC